MFKRFKRLDTQDEALSRVQENVDTAIGSLPSTEIIQGRLVKNIALISSATNSVDHKLGRALIGWQIIRIRSNSIIWDTQDTNSIPQLTLNLNCSANVTVDLWVF